MPAATAAAEPDDEPPGVWPRLRGFFVPAGSRNANGVETVFPKILAPARRAIATSDVTGLIKVPGIGRKGAERIIVELRDRIGSIDGTEAADLTGITAIAPWRDQLTHALAGLGFSGKEAADAVDIVASDVGDGPPDVPALLRRSIQLLGRTR